MHACMHVCDAASRKPQAASRKPQAASRKPQAASGKRFGVKLQMASQSVARRAYIAKSPGVPRTILYARNSPS
ncbi:hypothetical protein DPR02_37135 [Burkholderia cepacia]|uniref:Uncharacterized protein n=1 Tax=Burkholderia cepacia TaxID=292 RepID=A0AAQ0F5A1_BURCE|nr:hypothetical protein DPR02_37135 [Burkholderia cepacia]